MILVDRGADEDDDDEWEDTDEEGDFDSEGGFSGDEDGRGREFLFMDEETKSRFTEYSMTSSVMRRNEQLTLLDDRFEKVHTLFFFFTDAHADIRYTQRWSVQLPLVDSWSEVSCGKVS